jgi:hypothetical protein
LTTYEIKVVGSLGPAPGRAFAGLAVEAGPNVTVVSGDLDRRGLQVLLGRMRVMGLELLEIRQVRRGATSPLCGSFRLSRGVLHARQREQFEAQHQDAVQCAVQGGLVQVADQDGVRAGGLDPEIAECFAADIAQPARDHDPVLVRAHMSSD